MPAEGAYPGGLEWLAVGVVKLLRRLGAEGLVQSAVVRGLAKRLLGVPGRPTTRVIASGLGRGLWLHVLPGTPYSYWLGTHEPEVQAVFEERIKPGMVVYDCGANVGYFSLMLARLVGRAGRVYAFEPSPGSFDCLLQAASLNGLEGLRVVPRAVWNRTEPIRFVRGEGDSSLASDHVAGAFAGSADEGGFQVQAVALDDFVYAQGHPAPDFIKIDVEGSEGKALAGARRLLAQRRPPLLLEIHGEPGREAWAVLQEFGYQPRDIRTGRAPQTADEFAVWIRQYLATPA